MSDGQLRIDVGDGYDVIIGKKILSSVGEFIRRRIDGVVTVAIITDTKVASLYGETVLRSIKNAGYRVVMHAFPNGEANKTIETTEFILKFLAAACVTRTDLIVALGGGVVGDVAGFAASIYMRGMKFVQVPTTLLAVVDSSVGGKTGVNLKYGKNLVGTFWQPSLVVCDVLCLETLNPIQMRDGLAECIKHGVLANPEILCMIRNQDYKSTEFVEKNIRIKASYVEGDERDRGDRQMLNLGHTFGHAIEQISNFSVSHGQAVAVGMICVARAAYHLGMTTIECYFEILETLKRAKLPYECRFDEKEILDVILLDKKVESEKINLIYPRKVGDCVRLSVGVAQLPNIIRYAMKQVLI